MPPFSVVRCSLLSPYLTSTDRLFPPCFIVLHIYKKIRLHLQLVKLRKANNSPQIESNNRLFSMQIGQSKCSVIG